MNSRIRTGILWLAGLGTAFFLTGFQIKDYPFRPTQFGTMEGSRKIYKTQKEAEIKEIMKGMCEEIGAKCELCHNEKNYASEEKPMKDFARKKMLMLQWLNEKYRPRTAAWEYTCYTCHRGKVKPVPSEPPAAPAAKAPAKGR